MERETSFFYLDKNTDKLMSSVGGIGQGTIGSHGFRKARQRKNSASYLNLQANRSSSYSNRPGSSRVSRLSSLSNKGSVNEFNSSDGIGI